MTLRQRTRSLAVLAAAQVLVFVSPASPMDTIGATDCNYGRRVSYYFDSSVRDHAVLRSGFDQWKYVADWQGASVVTVGENLSNPDVTVQVSQWAASSANYAGLTTCGPSPRIWVWYVNTDYSRGTFLTDNALISDIALHEMGHVLGLDHVGDDDAFRPGAANPGSTTDTPAALATCLSAGNENLTLDNDDEAGLIYHNGPRFSDNLRYFASQVGFEADVGDDAWHTNPPDYWQEFISGNLSGYQHAGFYPYGASVEFHQYVHTAGLHPRNVDLAMSVRRTDALATVGNPILELFRRDVDYAGGGCGEWHNDGKNHNTRQTVSGLVLATSTSCANTTTWTSCVTPIFDTGFVPGHDAYDWRIRVRSSVRTTGGSWDTLHLDNLRIRDRG